MQTSLSLVYFSLSLYRFLDKRFLQAWRFILAPNIYWMLTFQALNTRQKERNSAVRASCSWILLQLINKQAQFMSVCRQMFYIRHVLASFFHGYSILEPFILSLSLSLSLFFNLSAFTIYNIYIYIYIYI
jgi:hypothetical protein